MLKYIWWYIICWKHKNMMSHEFMEQYMLVLMAGRRCAYDLAHVAGTLYGHSSTSSMFSERAEMWQNLFTPQGGKDYRHRLHKDIQELEIKLEKLENLCEFHNIDLPYEKIPF